MEREENDTCKVYCFSRKDCQLYIGPDGSACLKTISFALKHMRSAFPGLTGKNWEKVLKKSFLKLLCNYFISEGDDYVY